MGPLMLMHWKVVIATSMNSGGTIAELICIVSYDIQAAA